MSPLSNAINILFFAKYIAISVFSDIMAQRIYVEGNTYPFFKLEVFPARVQDMKL